MTDIVWDEHKFYSPLLISTIFLYCFLGKNRSKDGEPSSLVQVGSEENWPA